MAIKEYLFLDHHPVIASWLSAASLATSSAPMSPCHR
jgi:hypothetical protein